MKRVQVFRGAVAAVVWLVATAACVGACGDGRSKFESREQGFDVDASVDAGDCPFQCSVDGRSVIRACTGEIIETCPPDRACGGAACMEPCAAAAADRRSTGCEFYFQTPRFRKEYPQSCYAAFIVNTSNVPADISLELEETALDISKAMFRTEPGDATLRHHTGPIPPGESVVLFVSDRDSRVPLSEFDELIQVSCPDGVVPASISDRVPDGTGFGSSFHLKTNVPVAASAIYPFGGAATYLPAATLLLPVATWAKQHILINGWETGWVSGVPGAQIVASEDDTEVTIFPKRDILDGDGVVGTGAQIPATYRLRKGQLLQLVQPQELTGSIVESNKPTTIFGGHSCAEIPTKAEACDVLVQQIPAFEQWGSEFVGAGYRPRMGNEHEAVPYRIVAARDGTRLDYDPAVPPGAPTTLSAGEVATFHSGTGDAFVVRTQDAEHPIYVAAYMSGCMADYYSRQSFEGRGDPDFVNVVPAGQWLSSYSFYADPTFADTSLVIVRAKASGGEFKDVWLECAGNLTGWKPVGTRGDYEFLRVDLARDRGPGDKFGDKVCRNGLQRMRSDGPFTATLWGWDYAASYAYPGGMAQRKLVDTPLLPVH